MHWNKLCWRDYRRDTGHLSMIQHGAYLHLFAGYHLTGKPLPNVPDELYRMCKAMTMPERDAVDLVLNDLFVLKSDGWHYWRML